MKTPIPRQLLHPAEDVKIVGNHHRHNGCKNQSTNNRHRGTANKGRTDKTIFFFFILHKHRKYAGACLPSNEKARI